MLFQISDTTDHDWKEIQQSSCIQRVFDPEPSRRQFPSQISQQLIWQGHQIIIRQARQEFMWALLSIPASVPVPRKRLPECPQVQWRWRWGLWPRPLGQLHIASRDPCSAKTPHMVTILEAHCPISVSRDRQIACLLEGGPCYVYYVYVSCCVFFSTCDPIFTFILIINQISVVPHLVFHQFQVLLVFPSSCLIRVPSLAFLCMLLCLLSF